MGVSINQTYKTTTGRFLKVKTVRESGMHTLQLIDKKGNLIPERRNSFGHVIERSERICSNETIDSFKKVKIIVLLFLFCAVGYAQKKFVLAEKSIHKVVMTVHLETILFDGRVYNIDNSGNRKGWYKMKNDSITWIYGHNPNDFKDVVKIGFYNDFKNYVLSNKTEKK